MAPLEFTTQNSLKFKELFKKADIRYDDFIRTTEERHVDAVNHIWVS